jgi:DNA-binding CsgD family transcriptional regulator/sugar-specific transcriptional regulator TrmB
MTSNHEVNSESGPDAATNALQLLYAAALRQGASTREELVRGLDLPRVAVDDAFERLGQLGLLEPHLDRPGVYEPRLLESAEVRVITPLQRALQEAQTRVDAMRGEFAALREVQAAGADRGDVLAVDARDVNPMLEEEAQSCRTEVLTAQPGGPRPVKVLSGAQSRDLAMLEQGVRMRTIYQHSARFNPATEAYVERLVAGGAEVRTLHTLFPRLIVFDRRTAFLPAHDGPGALRIRHQGVVEFLVSTFETAWHTAAPFASAYETRRQGFVISDMQRAIARLLLEEPKDAAIARQLGISERSCRQHIAKLMTQLGANNRTHLGFLLASTIGEEGGPDSEAWAKLPAVRDSGT